MNVLRTGMNMSISCIHIWLCYTETSYPPLKNYILFAFCLCLMGWVNLCRNFGMHTIFFPRVSMLYGLSMVIVSVVDLIRDRVSFLANMEVFSSR